MRNKIESANATIPMGAYSQAVVRGSLMFSSGQGPFDKKGKFVDGSIEDQIRLTFENLKAILAAAEMNFEGVLKVTAYITDLDLAPQFDAVYREFITEPFPALDLIEVKALPMKAPIMVSVMAVKG